MRTARTIVLTSTSYILQYMCTTVVRAPHHDYPSACKPSASAKHSHSRPTQRTQRDPLPRYLVEEQPRRTRSDVLAPRCRWDTQLMGPKPPVVRVVLFVFGRHRHGASCLGGSVRGPQEDGLLHEGPDCVTLGVPGWVASSSSSASRRTTKETRPRPQKVDIRTQSVQAGCVMRAGSAHNT
jgi:hypothetical protein